MSAGGDFDISVLLGKDGLDSAAVLVTGVPVSATEVRVDVVIAVGLARETVLIVTLKVNDAVCVMGRDELRVSSIEDSEAQMEIVVSSTTVEDDVVGKDWGELRSGIRGEEWDEDVDWSVPAVVEIEETDEGDVSGYWPVVVDVIIESELPEAVTKLVGQSVVIVVHGAKEISVD